MKTKPIDFKGPVRAYLETLTYHRTGVDIEAFALRHGSCFTPAPLLPGIKHAMPKACFTNAINLALSHPELIYAEGFARRAPIGEPNIYYHHGWCVDLAGNVADPTWVSPSGTDYYGVAFQTSFVRDFIATNGPQNLIDREWIVKLNLLQDHQWKHPIHDKISKMKL